VLTKTKRVFVLYAKQTTSKGIEMTQEMKLPKKKMGRPTVYPRAMTNAERQQRWRDKQRVKHAKESQNELS